MDVASDDRLNALLRDGHLVFSNTVLRSDKSVKLTDFRGVDVADTKPSIKTEPSGVAVEAAPPSVKTEPLAIASVPTDDSALPLSSTTAHARHASVAAAASAVDAAHVARVQREYITLNLKKVGRVSAMPFPASLLPADAYQQLIRTVRSALTDILMLCDDRSVGLMDSDFVRGWERPLQKRILSAISPDKPTTSDLVLSISDYFQQVKRRLDDGATGPEAFTLLLRLLSEQFDVGDRQESFLRLQQFGVSNGTLFADYLRAFRLLVSSVTGSERVLAPSVSMVLEIVRNSVSKQFPSLAPMLYPGDLATAVTPFDSIDAMWQAFAPLATNKTPAIGGSEYFSLSSTPGSSQPRRSQNRAPTPAPSGRWAQGSAQNPVVLAVQSQGGGDDPFSRDYSAWPATQGDWSNVYQVSSSFRNTGDPFLWTPLLTQDARSQAFRENRNRCLNCSGDDHSMKHCPAPFTNSSGLLNPELGELHDKSDAFRRWQGRMRSYRRKPYTGSGAGGGRNKRHSSSSRRNHAGDYRNNGNSQNDGRNNGNFAHNSRQPSTDNTHHTGALSTYRPQSSVHTGSPPGSSVSSNYNARQPGNFQSGGQNGHNARGSN